MCSRYSPVGMGTSFKSCKATPGLICSVSAEAQMSSMDPDKSCIWQRSSSPETVLQLSLTPSQELLSVGKHTVRWHSCISCFLQEQQQLTSEVSGTREYCWNVPFP